MDDARSKLGRLAKRIERDLTSQFPPKTELDRMKIRQAAQLRALAVASGSSLGVDGLTPSRFGKLVGRADGAEARIAEQHAARNGNGHRDDDLAARILALPTAAEQRRPS